MFEITFPNPGADVAVFHFDFPFFQAADINVELDGELLSPAQYNLVPKQGAAISGIPYVGGHVEFSAAPGGSVRIFRRLRLQRDISYQPTEPILAVSLNRDFNFLLNVAKELGLLVEHIRISVESLDELGDLDIDAINDLILEIRNMGDLATEADLAVLRDALASLADTVQDLANRPIDGGNVDLSVIENQIFELEALIALLPGHTNKIAELSERIDKLSVPEIDMDALLDILRKDEIWELLAKSFGLDPAPIGSIINMAARDDDALTAAGYLPLHDDASPRCKEFYADLYAKIQGTAWIASESDDAFFLRDLSGLFLRGVGGLADKPGVLQEGSVPAIRGALGGLGLKEDNRIDGLGAFRGGQNIRGPFIRHSGGNQSGTSWQQPGWVFDSSDNNQAMATGTLINGPLNNNTKGDHGRRNETAPDNVSVFYYIKAMPASAGN